MTRAIAAVEFFWSILVAISMLALIPYASYWDNHALIRGLTLSGFFAIAPLAIAMGATMLLARRRNAMAIYLVLIGCAIATVWIIYVVASLAMGQIDSHWRLLPLSFMFGYCAFVIIADLPIFVLARRRLLKG